MNLDRYDGWLWPFGVKIRSFSKSSTIYPPPTIIVDVTPATSFSSGFNTTGPFLPRRRSITTSVRPTIETPDGPIWYHLSLQSLLLLHLRNPRIQSAVPSANSTITSTRSQLSASLHILSPSAPKVAQLKENHLSRQEYTYPLRHHVLNSHGCNIPKEGSVELHLYPYIALRFALRLLWSGDPLCKRMRQGSVLGEHVSAVYTVRHCCMLSSKPHKRHHCRMILIE